MPQWLRVLVVAAIAAPASAAPAAATLPTPPPGWTLEVVAAAPVVRHPSVVCCAPDGRVFVAEDPMDIALPSAELPRGRILCLHGDGRMTVFAENLHAVFGMQHLDGRLYVLHNPKFSVFADDGTGVGKDRRDLIECTNPNPWALNWNDHVPANFRLAMDGYFYVAVGDKGVYGAVGTDGKKVELRGGGILRLRPDGSGLEVFCTGVRNILDVAMNAEDEIFTYDNTDEHEWMGRLTHMVDGGFYGYPYDFQPRRPYTLWMMADFGAGAATGTECYTGDALPAEYHGNLFLADFGKRNVLRVRVEREGATYKAVSREDFFTDVPADFRPVGICFSPDGAGLYVCDWQHVDTKEDVAVGRLFKLTHAKAAKREPPAWYVPAATGRAFEATDDELTGALGHPSRAVRLVAQRRLADRGGTVTERLTKLLGDKRANPLARIHALWALEAIDGGAAARETILWATTDPDRSLRRQALRQLGTRRAREALPAVAARLADEDPSVRFQAAAACGRIADPSAVPALLDAAGDGDEWVRYAISVALNRVGRAHPQAWREVTRGLRHEEEPVRRVAAAALRDTYDDTLVAAVADVAADRSAPGPARVAAIDVLGPLHRQLPPWKGEWWAYHPALGKPPRKTEQWAGTPKVLLALRGALKQREAEVRMAALSALAEAGDGEAAEAIRSLLVGTEDMALGRQALAALASCDDGRNVRFLMTRLGRGDMNPLGRGDRDARLDADVLRTLGRLKAEVAVPVMAEYARRPAEALRSAAFDALVQVGGESAAAAAVDLMNDRALDVRLGAVRAAGELGVRSAVPALLTAYVARETRSAAITALAKMPDARAAEAYLEGMASAEFALREKCAAALREVRDEALPAVEAAVRRGLSDDVVLELHRVYEGHDKAKAGPLFAVKIDRKHPEEYLAFAVNQTGDARAGEKLFAEAAAGGVGCATCHAVNGRGGSVGPDLSGVGAKYSRRDLAESVLYPGKAVREGYQQVIVRTRGGQTYAGPLKAETPEELTLHEADGTLRVVRKADVAARKDSGLSPMPENLHAGLTVQHFADLVSYLESLKTEQQAGQPDAGRERR